MILYQSFLFINTNHHIKIYLTHKNEIDKYNFKTNHIYQNT